MDYLKFAAENARREFTQAFTGKEEPTSLSRRYCPMCETWWSAKHKECPDCGMDTERQERTQPNGR